MEWVIKKTSQNTWLLILKTNQNLYLSATEHWQELRVLKNWMAFAYETTSIWA